MAHLDKNGISHSAVDQLRKSVRMPARRQECASPRALPLHEAYSRLVPLVTAPGRGMQRQRGVQGPVIPTLSAPLPFRLGEPPATLVPTFQWD
jgi:hypothetical protein